MAFLAAMVVPGLFLYAKTVKKTPKNNSIPQSNQNKEITSVNDNKNDSEDRKPDVTLKETEGNKNVTPKDTVIANQTPVSNIAPQKTTLPPSPPKVSPNPDPAPSDPGNQWSPADFVEDQLLVLINAERSRKGLPPLVSNELLRNAAGIRVQEESITSFDGVNHTRPDGRKFDTVFSEVGYSGATSWGENLAWGYKTQISFDQNQLLIIANQLFNNWKNSPGHYNQIIDPDYNQTGFGVSLINQNGRTYYFGIELFAKK